MRIAAIVLLGLGLAACTKPNPDLCCTTVADCTAQAIPVGNVCGSGLVCRGNQCIAETCAASSDCDAAAPYCENQTCAETCTADPQCPGFGQDPGDVFCVGGACVACRLGMQDCPASAPICDTNACRGCQLDDECPSRVCDVDAGTCVDEITVLYASPAGPATADCSQATPCAIAHAVTLAGAAHPVIRMLPGSYPVSLTFTAGAPISIVGTGATLTGSNAITAIDVPANATISVRGLTIAATAGDGVDCEPTTGVATMTLRGLSVSGPSNAIHVGNCHLTLEEVVLGVGAARGDMQFNPGTTMIVDRSTIGLVDLSFVHSDLVLTITNSIIQGPVDVASSGAGPVTVHVSFSTINSPLICDSALTSQSLLFDNDIIVANATQTSNTIAGPSTCFDHDVVSGPQMTGGIGTNMIIADAKLVDAANGNYHLDANSPAIDAADPAATDAVDYDGVSRPQGSGRDIGAFEYKP